MKLPESAVAGTKNSEEALTKRLEEFRKNNTDENTVVNFFDEIEIHPILLNVEGADTADIVATIKKCIGHPRNYGPSPEEVAQERLKAEEIRVILFNVNASVLYELLIFFGNMIRLQTKLQQQKIVKNENKRNSSDIRKLLLNGTTGSKKCANKRRTFWKRSLCHSGITS